MATSSYEIGESSSTQNRFVYQVFLSFRGADVRKGWIDHLFRQLKEEGVRVFLDNDDLERGKKIDSLFEAIERSQIFLVTFSPGYCDSKWCLDELVKIMDCRANSVGQQQHVLPVFYNVEPTHVRHQTGPYEQAFKVPTYYDDTDRVTKCRKALFKVHENYDDIDRVAKYRKALEEVTKLKGLSLKDTNGYEGQLVNDVVKEVKSIVRTRELFVPQDIVGRNDILRDINMWLQDGSNDAQVAMIYGPGGIGKSTVAQIVYNHNLDNFSGSCFIADFQRKATKAKGLTYLLEQIISDISKKPPLDKIYDVLRGWTQVKAFVSCKKILLVLDDVDELTTQLKTIFKKLDDFFYRGSKIIITTRNQEVRKVCKFAMEFSISELGDDESTMLFSLHAFQSDQPPQGFMTLSRKFIKYCQGLPLALRVLGTSLFGDAKDIWESALEKLAMEPNHEVQSILRVSFNFIKDKVTKDLFLHIAHYFIGMRKDKAFIILEGMRLHPRVGFPQLVNRCLVTDEYGVLKMHQLVQEMAREVVREEARNQPGHRSRLLDFEDSYRVLKRNMGTENVRCLRLDFSPWKRVHLTPSPRTTILSDPPVERVVITTDAFTKMKNLELLQLYYVQLTGGYSDFPKGLRWFLWERCPLESIPSDLELDELVVLKMQESSLVHVWENTKELQKLKVIDLYGSTDLVDTPNFSGCPALERIVLDGCTNLVEIHGSITQLGRLTYISLEGCINLVSIPSFSGCPALEIISLRDCSKLVEIHESITLLRRLTHIDLRRCTNLVSTPDFSGCQALERIVLDGCANLVEIHGSITQLGRLTYISLQGCINLVSIPSFSGCSALECIHLEGCSKLVEIHGSITQLRRLTLIYLSHCTNLVSTPDFSGCHALVDISLQGCSKLVEIHGSITQLRRLTLINLGHCTNLVSTPDFSGCHTLMVITLRGCTQLVEIHESITQLRRLIHINLSGCANLVRTPDFSGCHALVDISLQGCTQLVEIHESITQLRRLTHINLRGCTNLVSTPDFSGCHALKNISLQGCSKLVEIHESITHLRRLTHINLSGCANLVSTPDFSGCPALDYISLEGCSKLVEIHESITQLRRLTHINLNGCTNLVSTPDFSGCHVLEDISLQGCTQLVEIHKSITHLRRLKYLNVASCESLRRIPRSTATNVMAYRCDELVEIGDNIKLESRTNLDACRTAYIGYSGLEAFVSGDDDGEIGCYRGVYQCGLYSVYLAGDHSAKWFNSMTQGPKLNYTVPMPSHPDRRIRALNICCVYKFPNFYAKGAIKVHNQSSSCIWCYVPILYPEGMESDYRLRTHTWLTHWHITQHRELNAGDMLEITFHGSWLQSSEYGSLKYGIRILYEDEATEEVAYHVQSHNTSSNDGEGPSGESVANWYDNTFRLVDLSTYECEPGVYVYKDPSIHLIERLTPLVQLNFDSSGLVSKYTPDHW